MRISIALMPWLMTGLFLLVFFLMVRPLLK